MTLLICVFAAIIATIKWYQRKDDSMMPGQGASAASYLESKAETERLAIMTASLVFGQTYA